MDGQNNNKDREGFEITRQCPLCQNKYSPGTFKILDRSGDKNLLHLKCPHCYHSFVVVIGKTPFGAGLVAITVDLDLSDAKRFYKRKPISQNQLLEIYNFIKTNKFNQILKRQI